MKLYHGSNIAIEKIDLSQGRPHSEIPLLKRIQQSQFAVSN